LARSRRRWSFSIPGPNGLLEGYQSPINYF
jgi:hypothetical protein